MVWCWLTQYRLICLNLCLAGFCGLGLVFMFCVFADFLDFGYVLLVLVNC